VVDDLTAWLSARPRGVTRARNEAHDSSVLVLNGAEVNRVLDYAQNGLRRVINAVVPQVNGDMLTYSSYDAMVYGSDAQSVPQSLTQAVQTIEKLAPDPQGTGQLPARKKTHYAQQMCSAADFGPFVQMELPAPRSM
jgi:hypothetical protein